MTEIGPVHFLDENIGFYYAGGLYKTTDSGNSFDFVCSGGWFELQDIYAVNENNVWGILHGILDGDGSTRGITKITSSDSETYTENIAWENDPKIYMSSIHFADETTGYIVGIKNNIGTIWKNGTGMNTMTISENEQIDNIKVYPNPTYNELNIVFNKLTKASIKLTDLTGKQIYLIEVNKNKTTIDTQGFPKGIYILSVKTDNKYLTKKIIIN